MVSCCNPSFVLYISIGYRYMPVKQRQVRLIGVFWSSEIVRRKNRNLESNWQWIFTVQTKKPGLLILAGSSIQNKLIIDYLWMNPRINFYEWIHVAAKSVNEVFVFTLNSRYQAYSYTYSPLWRQFSNKSLVVSFPGHIKLNRFKHQPLIINNLGNCLPLKIIFPRRTCFSNCWNLKAEY